MLIPRGALCTLIAGACAAESIEYSPPTVDANETRSPSPILLSARNPVSQQDGRTNESSQDEGQLGYTKSGLPAVKDNELEARQAAPVRPPTVFSTSYMTSTITTYVGEAVTSTIFETFTATASIAPQKRTIPLSSPPNEIQAHLNEVLRTSDDLPNGSDRKTRQKRQNNLSTVTSVIYMISRTVVTVAPTISTTIPVTVTVAIASDGSTTLLSPSTTSSLPSTTASVSQTSASETSSQSSQTSLPTGTPTTSTLNQGAIAGGVLGSLFAAGILLAIFLCCVRRRRRKREPKPTKEKNTTLRNHPGYTPTVTTTSTSSLARDEGTLIHHEIFLVGASPPASVAPSASEQHQYKKQYQQPANITPPPPSLQMKQVLPAIDDTSCELQRPSGMTRRQSNRAGRIWLVNNDSEEEQEVEARKSSSSNSSSSGGGSGFDSNEAQPPSPVASSDIFGPYDSTYRQTRDTWATSTDMSLSFSTPRNLTMLGSDFDEDPSRMSQSMEDAMWHGEDDDDDEEQQSEGESWRPSVPERSKRRSQIKGTREKAVRFQETPTMPTRKSSGSGGDERVDGSSAFL